MLHSALAITVTVLSLSGIAYCLIALWSARRFLQETDFVEQQFSRAVSILKPLKGAEAGAYDALRSHCLQTYPEYEIIFGVNSESDEAVPLVRRLISEFPALNIRLIACSEIVGANRKVSNLVRLAREARHSYLLVNDGDISVGPNYLQNVISRFADSTVGLVTCLYRGRPSPTIASRLEALGISTDFIPGVLTARYLEHGLRFALGSTMAMRRSALDTIGGFESVVDYLADDYQLGEKIAAAGFKIALAKEIVETSVPAYSFSQFWKHQMRWARTLRVSRPSGYFGVLLTFVLPWSVLLAVIAPRHWWSWALLLAAVVVRLAMAAIVAKGVLHDEETIGNLWLLPFRDFLAPIVWAGSFAGNEITWRGDGFRIQNGKLVPLGLGKAASASAITAEVKSQRR